MSMFDAPHFQDDDAAREHLEMIRWPEGPVCPHCGETERIKRMEGKSHRPGLHKCYACSGHFTVTVGTLFERSKIPLRKWFQAVYLLCSSKKGISTHQLHRMLGVTYKTAWFMTHRIREAMRDGGGGMLGGGGGTVEVDETFLGQQKPKKERFGRGGHQKEKVLTLVERGGRTRSFHVEDIKAKTLLPIIREQVAKEARIVTDEAGQYWRLGETHDHQTVHHGKEEWVRGDVHTNTIEGFFSIFKRGMRGVYQKCGKRHLTRYLAEFDFRYNHRHTSDWERTVAALNGISGKRLTYRSGVTQSS